MMRLRVGPHVYELTEAEEAEVLALTEAALRTAITGDREPDPEREAAGEYRRLLKAERDLAPEEMPTLLLSVGDINRLRQWYNSLTDTSPAYLEPEDRVLYERFLAALGRRS